MLQDPLILSAVTRIKQRSEKELDQDKLINSFVDSGIRPLLINDNNQIIYGRRGTGKTHLLKVIAATTAEGSGVLPVYIDSRILGSTSQFSDVSLPLGHRCLALFRDIFGAIHDALIQRIVNYPGSSADANQKLDTVALTLADEMIITVTSGVESVIPEKIEATTSRKRSAGLRGGIRVTTKGPEVSLGSKSQSNSSDEAKTSYAVKAEDKIVFPDLQSTLNRVLKEMNVRLIILLDEWSSVPIDLQPYLAELLKRSVIPNPLVTLKVASLEYRSQFSSRKPNGTIVGLELGADISTALDIDNYYVYDRNPKQIADLYSNILYSHLKSDIGESLRDRHKVESCEAFVVEMFESRVVFQELARAAEGVVRDLINIFTSAALNANRRSKHKVDHTAVLEAAREWYQQDKVCELTDGLRKVLERITFELLSKKRARTFLIPRELEKHSVVQQLFDARVLHLIRRAYPDKSNPARRYNIYSIDYGAYADVLNPKSDLVNRGGPTTGIAPFDDDRRMRKIMLPENILSPRDRERDEIDRHGFGGLRTGEKWYHEIYGIVTIEEATSETITIQTEARETKMLATRYALAKFRSITGADLGAARSDGES